MEKQWESMGHIDVIKSLYKEALLEMFNRIFYAKKLDLLMQQTSIKQQFNTSEYELLYMYYLAHKNRHSSFYLLEDHDSTIITILSDQLIKEGLLTQSERDQHNRHQQVLRNDLTVALK